MTGRQDRRFLWQLLYLALGFAGAWLFVRYVLGWLLPFLIAFAVAHLIEPAVGFIVRKTRLRRAAASGLCVLTVYGLVAGLFYLIVSRILYEAGELLHQLPALVAQLPPLTESFRERVYSLIISVPVELQDFLTTSFENFMSRGITIPANLYSFLATFLSSTVLSLPAFMLFIVACLLSTYFISRDYRAVVSFLMAQLPPGWKTKLLRTKDNLIGTLGKWLRAQAILMGLTFVETAVGLLIAGVDYFLLMALVVAFVDALPVLGSGTVLVPWGLAAMLSATPARGVLIILLYIVIVLVRSLTEPRLVGRQIGLHPLVTLAAMYVGLKAIGVWGILLFPVLIITLKQLQEWDYISIWKQ